MSSYTLFVFFYIIINHFFTLHGNFLPANLLVLFVVFTVIYILLVLAR